MKDIINEIASEFGETVIIKKSLYDELVEDFKSLPITNVDSSLSHIAGKQLVVLNDTFMGDTEYFVTNWKFQSEGHKGALELARELRMKEVVNFGNKENRKRS